MAPPILPAPPQVYAPPQPYAPAYAPPQGYAPYAPPPGYAPPPMPQAMPGTGGSFQGPVYYNGPVWVIPAPGNPQYAPPPAYAPPLPPVYAPPQQYYVPPPRLITPTPRYLAPLPLRYKASRLPPARPRGPVVAMGVRFSAMGISSQEIFGQKVNLYGGGLMMRFRSQGRFGFELSMDVLRANINNDAFVRTSYPFTAGPMLYLFENRPERHFNIYAVAGFGLMADDVNLYKGTPQERNQQFWEVMGHAGGGMEVRMQRLAIFADARAIGMLLDDSSPAGMFYRNVDGGPIPANSAGFKINVGALLWF
jgi:hypothetical protein